MDPSTEANLEKFAAFPADGSPAKILGQHFFIARVPGAADNDHASLQLAGEDVASRATPAQDAPQELLLFDVPATERHGVLMELIRRHLAEMLRFDSPQQIDRKRRFMDLGVDSLMAIELRHRLQSALRLLQPLSATVVFDYPTIDALADHLEQEVLGMDGDREPRLETFQEIGSSMAGRAEELAKLDDSDVEALLLSKLELL